MIATDIVDGLKRFNPKAIAFWGSYGLGLNDKYTHDVDITVYVTKLPSKNSRQRLLGELSERSLNLPYGGDFFIRDKIYEITFILSKDIEKKVKSLKEGDSTVENDVAVFVYETKIIYDTGWLKLHKSKIRVYPQALFERNLKQNLLLAFRKIHHHNRALNKRKQPIWAEYVINRGINYLIRTIFALNKTYYGKDKWIENQMSKFKIKPRNFEKNITQLLKTRDMQLYKNLVKDVFDLCKKYYPKESDSVFQIDKQLQKIDAQAELRNQ